MSELRYSVAIRTSVLVALSLLALVACDGAGSNDTAQPEACSPPEFSPTYLPWGEGPVPEPEVFTAQLNSISQWISPESYGTTATLGLVRRYRPFEDIAHMPKVTVRGHEGRLVWIGDPGVGELSLQWSEGEQACDHYGLSMVNRKLGERGSEKELLKVARSLR